MEYINTIAETVIWGCFNLTLLLGSIRSAPERIPLWTVYLFVLRRSGTCLVNGAFARMHVQYVDSSKARPVGILQTMNFQ